MVIIEKFADRYKDIIDLVSKMYEIEENEAAEKGVLPDYKKIAQRVLHLKPGELEAFRDQVYGSRIKEETKETTSNQLQYRDTDPLIKKNQ